jgi:hypothetical protein
MSVTRLENNVSTLAAGSINWHIIRDDEIALLRVTRTRNVVDEFVFGGTVTIILDIHVLLSSQYGGPKQTAM